MKGSESVPVHFSKKVAKTRKKDELTRNANFFFDKG